jgi:hypothetical protein
MLAAATRAGASWAATATRSWRGCRVAVRVVCCVDPAWAKAAVLGPGADKPRTMLKSARATKAKMRGRGMAFTEPAMEGGSRRAAGAASLWQHGERRTRAAHRRARAHRVSGVSHLRQYWSRTFVASRVRGRSARCRPAVRWFSESIGPRDWPTWASPGRRPYRSEGLCAGASGVFRSGPKAHGAEPRCGRLRRERPNA